MNPEDIGLPAKFKHFRQSQLDAALQIASSEKRFVIESMPTGAGKSVIYMTVSKLLDVRSMALTANKGLQQQLNRDFGSMGLVDVRGQGNYPCRMLMKKFPGRPMWVNTCDKGPCHFGHSCNLHPRSEEYEPGCDFYDQLWRVRKAKFVSSNYDFWMAANRYMDEGVLGNFDLLKLDEAHDAPDKLADFCAVKITDEEAEEFLGGRMPPVEDGVDAWVEWAGKWKFSLSALAQELRGSGDIDYMKKLNEVLGKVSFLATAHVWHRGEPTDPDVKISGLSSDWVGEMAEDKTYATFSPVWAHRYAEKFLFRGIPRVVLVSATIMPRTAHYLGIPDGEFEFREHRSGFAVDRRPIYYLPTVGLNFNSGPSDIRAAAIKIDQILATRPDRKGLIQVPSYKLAFDLRMACHSKNRIMFHKKDDVKQRVEQFRMARPGTFLISPVLHQGYDFPYEQCEVIIVAKVPFASTQSAVMKARARADKQYLNYLTSLKLVQSCGRGMRAEDDRCETFILDTNMDWFYPAAKQMLPGWFRAAYRKTESIPAPAPKLEPRPHRS